MLNKFLNRIILALIWFKRGYWKRGKTLLKFFNNVKRLIRMDIPMTIQHVYDGIYIGDADSLQNSKVLKEMNIKLAVNCACELYMKRFQPDTQWYLFLNLEDNKPIPRATLISALASIRTFRENNEKVLVACAVGASRSASIILSSMIDAGWEFDDAYNHLKKIRPLINPANELIESIKEYFNIEFEYGEED